MQQHPEGYHERRIGVPQDFEQIISYFYSAVNLSQQSVTKTLVPSFQTMLVFSFAAPVSFHLASDAISLEECIVLGPVKQPLEYTLPPGADMLVVNFKDDAFYRFFGPALAAGMVAAHPDALLEQSCFHQLWSSLKNGPTDARAGVLLDFCKPYLRCREAMFEDICGHAFDNLAASPVKAAALKTGQSRAQHSAPS